MRLKGAFFISEELLATMWYTYIVKCKDGSLYTGYTNELDKRLKKHNKGCGSKYTRSKKPVTLVYSEKFDRKLSATRREREIKKLSHRNKLKLASSL